MALPTRQHSYSQVLGHCETTSPVLQYTHKVRLVQRETLSNMPRRRVVRGNSAGLIVVIVVVGLLTLAVIANASSTREKATPSEPDQPKKTATKTTVVLWEEELPVSVDPLDEWDEIDVDDEDIIGIRSRGRQGKSPRDRRPWIRFSAPSSSNPSLGQSSTQKHKEPEVHPLRTDTWELTLQVHGPAKRLGSLYGRNSASRENQPFLVFPDNLQLEFAENGYVRCKRWNVDDESMDSETRRRRRRRNRRRGDRQTNDEDWYIGAWELTSTGLAWSLPYRQTLNSDASRGRQHGRSRRHDEETKESLLELLFFADFHLNPFGSQPRLTRGVILVGDRPGQVDADTTGRRSLWGPQWFRPVVASFTGVGTGRDTVDLSYKDRGS